MPSVLQEVIPNLHNFNKMEVLRYANVAPDSALHAALLVGEGTGFQVREHGHDFYEWLFVVEGEGLHGVNGAASTPLVPGTLTLLTPADTHWVRYAAGKPLHYFNVAFPQEAGRALFAAAGMEPPAHRTEWVEPAAGAALFAQTLRDFLAADRHASRLMLCSFLVRALSLPQPPHTALPPWLGAALSVLNHDPHALQEGVPYLRAHTGVSATHLSRTMRTLLGVTPTDYVNRLRLERAAYLLATTPWPIARIAAECGFAQQPYFCRLFHARHGVSPRTFRQSARRPVVV
jgi:AraC-like DNA-binding protein/mannose-6-phosphate isomerase-like protein (cupin superfamily)